MKSSEYLIQKRIGSTIRGHLLAFTIIELILLLSWQIVDPFEPGTVHLILWTLYGLFLILPIGLLLLSTPRQARQIEAYDLTGEAETRVPAFLARYHQVGHLLFLCVCYAALPAFAMRWLPPLISQAVAALVALGCGTGAAFKLLGYYGAVEHYYEILPANERNQVVLEAEERRERGVPIVNNLIFAYVLPVIIYLWYNGITGLIYNDILPPDWRGWIFSALMFFLALAVVSELRLALLLRHWVPKARGEPLEVTNPGN